MGFRYSVFTVFLLTSACTTNYIAPAYRENLDTALTIAYTKVSTLTACIDLGLCASGETFAAQQANYTAAVANLKSAKLIAAGLPADSDLAIDTRDDLVSFIDGCLTQLFSLAELHQAGSTLPDVGVTQPVDVACNQAMTAVQALK